MPLPVCASEAPDVERELRRLDEQVTFVQTEYTRSDETSSTRVRRKFFQGEMQMLLEDWAHAAILLYEVVDAPESRQSGDYPAALFHLGEALHQMGARASAQANFRRALDHPQAPHYREALLRAIDGAISLGNPAEAEGLVARARKVWAQLPPEVLYLSAKALYLRRDLPAAERMRRTLEALAAVPPPFHLAAAYLKGALFVQAGDLRSAAAAFRGCTEQQPQALGSDSGARQAKQRELCQLALARTDSDLGRYSEAFDRYQEIPRDSPRFNEAIFEVASTYVRAKKWEQALRTAVLVPELAPGTPLAPEAALLEGHLHLRLGRYASALESYNQVIDQYAPIRDEIDAMLALHDDPTRYFDEIIARSERAFDVSNMLPPLAVKWASTQTRVAAGLQMVTALDQGKRDLDQGDEIAERLDAALTRGDGLDAFPHLEEGYARAEAVENAALRLQARIAAQETELLASGLDGLDRAELASLQSDRADLEERMGGLPGSPAEVEARLVRFRGRLADVDRAAFRAGFVAEGCQAALSAVQIWVDGHRAELRSAEGQTDFLEEMRKHREVVAGYREELRALQREILQAEDAVAGPGLTAGEAALRDGYRRILGREWTLLARGRDKLGASARQEVDRLEDLRRRIGAIDSRAEAAKREILARARAGADALRRRIAAERRALAAELASHAGLQADTKKVVGRIAQHSLQGVRGQIYRLVLKADLGIVDVSWQRKRERLEKIQQLSARKAADLAGLDEEFQGVLQEVQQ